jgi:pimeloyl-ACP methyl ester carboxylesterase
MMPFPASGEAGHSIVAGRRLEVRRLAQAGPSPGTIVMLHEGLGSIALWRDFPQRVRDRTGYEVVAYSRYGHGWSEALVEKRDPAYMHHEAEAVLPELLDTLGIRRPVLLGHSDGGSIALVYAGGYPHGVQALILEAPHVFVEELSLRSIAQLKTTYETTDFRAKLARYHGDVDGTFRGWNDIWLDPSFRAWNIESSLDAIRCPLLVIQGEDDEFGTVAQLAAIEARVPAAQTVLIPHCGHSPHRDRPEATLAAIARFLEQR